MQVYILPKHPHITKSTHYKSQTYTHPHITKQVKTATVQVQTEYKMYPSEIVSVQSSTLSIRSQ